MAEEFPNRRARRRAKLDKAAELATGMLSPEVAARVEVLRIGDKLKVVLKQQRGTQVHFPKLKFGDFEVE